MTIGDLIDQSICQGKDLIEDHAEIIITEPDKRKVVEKITRRDSSALDLYRSQEIKGISWFRNSFFIYLKEDIGRIKD